jgi:hypothetical protein
MGICNKAGSDVWFLWEASDLFFFYLRPQRVHMNEIFVQYHICREIVQSAVWKEPILTSRHTALVSGGMLMVFVRSCTISIYTK